MSAETEKTDWKSLIAEFLDYQKGLDRAGSTLESHTINLGYWTGYLDERGVTELSAVTPQVTADYQAWLYQRRTRFGRSFTVLVVWNEGLYETQRKTVEREVTKCARKLSEEQARLARWHSRGRCGGHRPTPTVVRKRVAAILRGQHMKALFEIDITPHSDHPELGCLDWRVSAQALADLERRSLGKTLLFTDRADWNDEDVVAAYRGQHHVEGAFRQMKDTGHVSFRPTYHWTDQKLRVHAFTCVTALLLCTLLRRRLAQQGIELSVDGMLEALGSVREVHVLLTSGRGRPRVRRTHSELSPVSRRLFDELELAKHLR